MARPRKVCRPDGRTENHAHPCGVTSTSHVTREMTNTTNAGRSDAAESGYSEPERSTQVRANGGAAAIGNKLFGPNASDWEWGLSRELKTPGAEAPAGLQAVRPGRYSESVQVRQVVLHTRCRRKG